MSWLYNHLENFVKPTLGFIPSKDIISPFLSVDEMVIIKNAWRSVKRYANRLPILLPGRDVWIFEVLARRENYPTIFIPEYSRKVVKHLQLPDIKEYLLLDTGFVGTIPAALKSKKFLLFSHRDSDSLLQVFPRRSGSRGLALKIESLPKYWECGRIVDNKIVQPFAGLVEIAKAAILTQQIYTDSSPRFTLNHTGGLTWNQKNSQNVN